MFLFNIHETGRKKGWQRMAKVMKKALAALALVLMGGAVLFLGTMLTFGMIAAFSP